MAAGAPYSLVGHIFYWRGAPPPRSGSRLPPLADALPAARLRAGGLAWPQALLTLSSGTSFTGVGPHPHALAQGCPHSLMPRPLRAYALAGWHGRRRSLLSRGAHLS